MPEQDAVRPLNIIDIFRETFSIYRRNALTFLTISAVVLLPLALISTVFATISVETLNNIEQTSLLNDPTSMPAVPPELISVLLNTLIVSYLTVIAQLVLANSVITRLSLQDRLGMPAKSVMDTIREILPQWPKIIAAYTGLLLLIVAMSIGLALVYYACGLGFGLIFYLATAGSTFLVPVYIIEGSPFKSGIKYSWALGRKYIWITIRITIVLVILMLVITSITNMIQQLLVSNTVITETLQIILILIDTLGTIIIAPIMPIAFTVLYTMILQQNLVTSVTELFTPQELGTLLTGKDLSNIGLICLLGFLIIMTVTLFLIA